MSKSQIFVLFVMPFLLGGIHGFFTNWMAVKLLLYPVKPIFILGFRLQGLLPRRQAELADRIAEAVAREFLTEKDITALFKKAEPGKVLKAIVSRKWDEKVGEILAGIPLISMFITPDKLGFIRDKVMEIFDDKGGEVIDELIHALENQMDVRALIRDNILAFDVLRLNQVIEDVGAKEMGEIAWVGAIFGTGVGALHALINWLAH